MKKTRGSLADHDIPSTSTLDGSYVYESPIALAVVPFSEMRSTDAAGEYMVYDAETMHELKRVVSEAIAKHGVQRAADMAGCAPNSLYRILRGRNVTLTMATKIVTSRGYRWTLVEDK
jgi:hypothetical protein